MIKILPLLILIFFMFCSSATELKKNSTPTADLNKNRDSETKINKETEVNRDKTAEAALNKEIQITLKQEITIKSEQLKISFIAIKEDSRCPEGAGCVWAGNAKVAIKLSRADKEATMDLNSNLEPRKSAFLDYEIEFVDLVPHPVINKSNDNEVAKVTIKVVKK